MEKKMPEQPVFLSNDDVARLLTYEDLIPRLEVAMGGFSRRSGDVVQPVRSELLIHNHSGCFGLMPAYIAYDDTLCTKLLATYRRAENLNLPSIQATVLVLNPVYGNVTAIMDGIDITNKRTAAVSAISAKLLMPTQSDVLCILGCGQQAVGHYEIFTKLFSFKEYNVTGEKTSCVTHLSATIAVGACRADARELDDALMRDAVIYVDSREGAALESGDIIMSGEWGYKMRLLLSLCLTSGKTASKVCNMKCHRVQRTTIISQMEHKKT